MKDIKISDLDKMDIQSVMDLKDSVSTNTNWDDTKSHITSAGVKQNC